MVSYQRPLETGEEDKKEQYSDDRWEIHCLDGNPSVGINGGIEEGIEQTSESLIYIGNRYIEEGKYETDEGILDINETFSADYSLDDSDKFYMARAKAKSREVIDEFVETLDEGNHPARITGGKL